MSIAAGSAAASPAVDSALTGSPRIRLARVAYVAALGVPGVVGTDAGEGGLYVTCDRDEQVNGVLCVAAPGGGYEVSLRLVCGLVPLHPLADAVQGAVIRAAALAQLPLERVDVHVVAVSDRRWD